MGMLKQPGFAELAQAFVEATSPLVSNRTINIMELDGTIIASTEKERIGTYHHGARLVAETGKPVIIEPGQVKEYPGAKEGANLPILDQGRLIGVVGLYGKEQEIRDAANLLRVYVTQFFRQQSSFREKTYRRELSRRLLQLLLTGRPEDQEERENLQSRLGVQFSYPLVLLGLRWKGENGLTARRNLEDQLEEWLQPGKGRKQTSFYGELDQQLVVLHSLKKGEEGALLRPERDPKGLLYHLVQRVLGEKDCALVVSQLCHRPEDLPEARHELETLLERPAEKLQFVEESRIRVRYLLERLRTHGGRAYAEQAIRRGKKQVTEHQWQQLLATARCYYEEQGSVQRAAERLDIHKNTLQYRLKRLYEVLQLEEATAFEREFLIQTILLERTREEK